MILFLIAFSIWALAHSLTASARFKNVISRIAGQRFYDGWFRLFYNGLSFVTILPILVIGRTLIPDELIWSLSNPIRLLFYSVQLLAILGLAVSLWQTDIWRFLGISQLMRYLTGESDVYNPPMMTTTGMYGYTRHPLYFFSLLVIWFFPTMTLQLLLFNLGATIYFLAGSIHEERRLLNLFGEEYRNYCAQVPWILPVKFK